MLCSIDIMKLPANILLICILLINISCLDPCSEPCIPDDPKDTTIIEPLPYELVWQTPLHPDTLYSITVYFYPIIYKDQVILSKQHGYSYNEIIKSFNRFTGEPLWEWDDYFKTPQDLSSRPTCYRWSVTHFRPVLPL